jgi:hypothetical protein
MTDFFVRPWEIYESGEIPGTVTTDGEIKTFGELRQRLYENIVDETLFIARASENAVSAEWLMDQPIFIRKKYVEAFKKEVKEREAKLNQATKNNGRTRRMG